MIFSNSSKNIFNLSLNFKENMENKSLYIWLIIVIVIILGASIYYMQITKENPTSVTDNNSIVNEDNNDENNDKVQEKTFTLTTQALAFLPTEIRVNEGDRVKVIINNLIGFHDFVIDEFDVKSSQTQAPSTMEVEFTAHTAGTYEFYCSVGNHRELGMVGTLIVK
jgi:plastocyanin